jgi:hypothetical protein
MGYLQFAKSFVLEVFQEDFNMITKLIMLVDLHATFALLLFYYAQ